MKKNLSIILLVLSVFIIFSCKTNFKMQIYRFEPSINLDGQDESETRRMIARSDVKFITLKNDSVLIYTKRNGGLASSIELIYRIVNDELIIDSLNYEGKSILNVMGVHFLYSSDSLINKRTLEKYFNRKYFGKIKNGI